MKPKIIREPFREFYNCSKCGEMIPKMLLTKDGRNIPDTKVHFKSCYVCGTETRLFGRVTARRVITTQRYGFLWLRVKRSIEFEYPEKQSITRVIPPQKIITLPFVGERE